MPFPAPLAEIDWNVAPPRSVLLTLTAVPVVVAIELPAPVTVSVPLFVALMPAPVVASTSRPPPEKLSVWPSLPVNETAAEPTLLMAFDALLKVVEPPVLPERLMPPPASFVSAIAPLSVTAPPVRPVISAVWPAPLFRAPGSSPRRCRRRGRKRSRRRPRSCRLSALKVPVPRPARLMPSFALFVELTASNTSVAPAVPVTSTAGPPVALTLAVPAAETARCRRSRAGRRRRAGGRREREVAERRRAGRAGHAHAAAARAGDGDGVERARAHVGGGAVATGRARRCS